MRNDPYNESERATKRTKRATTKPAAPSEKRNPGALLNYFGDNPPIRIEITYRNGDKDILKGEQIDADNPVIKALGKMRTCRRFWTDPTAPEGEQNWSTDEELLEFANSVSLTSTFTSVAERAAEIGAKLGLKSKYYLTGEDGEPLTGKNGFWIEADSAAAGAYVPGTHTPAT